MSLKCNRKQRRKRNNVPLPDVNNVNKFKGAQHAFNNVKGVGEPHPPTPADVKRLLDTPANSGDATFRALLAEIEAILTQHRGPG